MSAARRTACWNPSADVLVDPPAVTSRRHPPIAAFRNEALGGCPCDEENCACWPRSPTGRSATCLLPKGGVPRAVKGIDCMITHGGAGGMGPAGRPVLPGRLVPVARQASRRHRPGSDGLPARRVPLAALVPQVQLVRRWAHGSPGLPGRQALAGTGSVRIVARSWATQHERSADRHPNAAGARSAEALRSHSATRSSTPRIIPAFSKSSCGVIFSSRSRREIRRRRALSLVWSPADATPDGRKSVTFSRDSLPMSPPGGVIMGDCAIRR